MENAIQENIRQILEETPGINLFFAMKSTDGEIKIRSADLQDGNTQEHMKSLFIPLLKEDFVENTELNIVKMSEADERINTIYQYDMAEFPASLNYFAEFDYNNEYPRFKFGQDDLIDLVAYMIVIGTQDKHCILYKRFYPVFLLGRGSFFLFPAKQRFEEFNNDLLRVSRDYDFLKFGNEIFIKNLDVLEKFGGFKQIIENEAEAAVDVLENMDILEEADILREHIESDLTFARKLCKIRRTSPVLSLHISNDIIIEFSRTHPGVAGKLRYNENGDRILLTTKKSQNLFMKLLDDSFLTSQLTNLYYDSMAKEQVI